MPKNKIILANFAIFLFYGLPCMVVSIAMRGSLDMLMPGLAFGFLWLLHVIINLGIALVRWLSRKDANSKYYLFAALILLLIGPVSCAGVLGGIESVRSREWNEKYGR